MKKKLVIVGIILWGLLVNTYAKSDLNRSEYFVSNFSTGIEEGWYQATIKYENSKTGTYETYSLKVQVQYDKVVKIDFGNGGSVHSGYNNEGYIYTGGSLSFEKDYNGNTTAAATTVTISDSNGLRYFKIRIE